MTDEPKQETTESVTSLLAAAVLPTCGVVMPISAIDNCSESHWQDVKRILFEAISQAGFAPRLVSDSDDVGVIQKRIVENLYQNEIVVCDVSGLNPNVFFELGMRLTFDKATVIVKDDKTNYSFDTSPIEHLKYPRDLRYGLITTFKELLASKIKASHAAATDGASPFLKSFGTFVVPTVETKEVPQNKVFEELLRRIESDVSEIKSRESRSLPASPRAGTTLFRKQPDNSQSIFLGNDQEFFDNLINSTFNQLASKWMAGNRNPSSDRDLFAKEMTAALADRNCITSPIHVRAELERRQLI